MRCVLALLALATLAGCSGDPYIKIRSPLTGGADPVLQPAGYAMQPVVAPQLMAAPAPQACAPAAAAPQYTQGYTYNPPPVPAAPQGCR